MQERNTNNECIILGHIILCSRKQKEKEKEKTGEDKCELFSTYYDVNRSRSTLELSVRFRGN